MDTQSDAPRTMHIGAPHIEQCGERVRLIADIDLGGGDVRPLWVEVDACYGQYLCAERSDAFLIGLLHYAMCNHYDVVCEAPVTAEILLRFRTVLIPALVHNSRVMHETQIEAPVATEPIPNAGAVGTGLSCGVDSLHAVKSQLACSIPGFSLTHLCNFDVGAFWRPEKSDENAVRQAQWSRNHAQACATALGLPLLTLDSNLVAAFRQDHGIVNLYSNLFAILALQRLWRAYFVASLGYGMAGFSVANAERTDSAHYDLLLLDCCSTPTLRLSVEAAALTRVEKTRDLVDWPVAQQFLHVCNRFVGPNCGACRKCLRTQIILDALGKLDAFGRVFDLATYRTHRKRNLRWCYEQTLSDEGDAMTAVAYALLKSEIPWWVRGGVHMRFLVRPFYHALFRNRLLQRPIKAFERWRRRLIGDYSMEELA